MIVHIYFLIIFNFFLTANFSIDREVLKQLIDQEIERIKTRLIDFAVYMREIKVKIVANYICQVDIQSICISISLALR